MRTHTHTYQLLFKFLQKLKTKKQNLAAKYYDIQISQHKTECFKKMNKIHHMHSAPTLQRPSEEAAGTMSVGSFFWQTAPAEFPF